MEWFPILAPKNMHSATFSVQASGPEPKQWQQTILAWLCTDVHHQNWGWEGTLLEGSWGRQGSILLSVLWALLAQQPCWV